MNATIVDTQGGIQFAHLAALKGALRLEVLGMKRRGRSALSIAKATTGLSSNDRLLQIAAIELKMDGLMVARIDQLKSELPNYQGDRE